MIKREKVSIIVPIYNVEKFLRRSIESIIDQTYRNLEIILVNDGSPDNCGQIAEEYAKLDDRIRVIHKENGGLSDARNAGMKHVTGEFTIFVDSDDWMMKNMIEEMLKICHLHKADAVQSAFFYAYDDYLLYDNRYFTRNGPPIILNNKALMTELVKNEKVKNFAWGKLYKTELIKDLPFKKGVLFEDVFWAHKVMQRVNKYVILHEPLYYYLQRSNSIISTYTTRNLDMLVGLKERHRFIERFYESLSNESYKTIFKTSLVHYNLLILNRKIDKKGAKRKEIYRFIKSNYYDIQRAVQDDKQLTQELKLFITHPSLNFSMLVIKRILRKLKLLPQPVGLQRIQFKGDLPS